MEGLLPMVFKAIKRSKERSHYEYLSSSTARTYDISDFYLPGGGQAQARSQFFPTPPPTENGMVDKGQFAGRRARHSRSYSSAAELSFGKSLKGNLGMPRKQQQQQKLVRFRSTRMLSCLTGA